MNLKITVSHFEKLIKKSYSIDIVYLLKLVESGVDISSLGDGSVKIATLYQSLIRKGLLTADNQITLQGKEVLNFINIDDVEDVKIRRVKMQGSDFDLFWKTYPGTDTFVHKGMTFTGSRTLRVNKEECKIKFESILLQGEYTASDIVQALEYDVLQKKENSVAKRTNKLTYMQNSLTYLNQRSFEPYIELVKSGIKVKEYEEPNGGGFDI